MVKKWWFAPVIGLWLALAVFAWLRPADAFSNTERRALKQFPDLSSQSLLDGSFMKDFETYTLDQFPMRDRFRSLKAVFHYGALRQKDNNGIYLKDGSAAQLQYPLNEKSVDHALRVFRRICDNYLEDSKIYFTVAPDKSYYLAGEEYPAMDYEALFHKIRTVLPDISYVNLTDLLTAQDYYRTDTHWRQEKLLPAAQRLCDAMGVALPQAADYTAVAAPRPFYGVYYGQAALPMEPETLYTMESSLLESCRVYNYETDRYGTVYDRQKLEGKDLYEVFLSGAISLLRIENPQADTERELIVFRDSFGSSMVPLLVQGYRTVTLVDVRYISSAMLPKFLDFHGQDVLFLYSTLVLNNSFMLK